MYLHRWFTLCYFHPYSDPIAAVHQAILETYLSHGNAKVSNIFFGSSVSVRVSLIVRVFSIQISDTSRHYFVMNRQGFLVPIKGHMSSSGDNQVMIAEEIQCSSNFIWFVGEEFGWRVTAVSQGAQRLLGIDMAAMYVAQWCMLLHVSRRRGSHFIIIV